MKQAKQMQEKLQEAQEKAAEASVEGSAGAGLVKVVMNGRHEVSRVSLAPTLLNEELSVIEDLLCAGVNDAVRKIDSANKESLSGVAGGLNLPPGFKLPF
jgi:DNA-binding YbaB/EbfC family protein